GMFHLKDKKSLINAILSDAAIDRLHSSGELPGYNKFYSNGWGVLKTGGQCNSLLSNGAIAGAASSLLILPEQDIAIVCLTNATVGNDFTDQIALSIADKLVPGYFDSLGKFMEKNSDSISDIPFQMEDAIIGTWYGSIKTYKDTIPLEMVFERGNRIIVHIKGQFETLLNNVSLNNGLIHGQSFGVLSLPETEGIPHYLEWTLMHGKNELFGNVSAQSSFSKRPYFLLPAYLQLSKKP
ncbi:MAG TPA: hypothetical protein VFQ58_04435, partial [Flavisolibacter sp.]|nr:hypothetical protein [Flavisolibacter sp.]